MLLYGGLFLIVFIRKYRIDQPSLIKSPYWSKFGRASELGLLFVLLQEAVS